METKTKNGLLFSILFVLLIPFVDQNLSLVKSGVLYNYPPQAPDTAFSFGGWLSGRYQQKKGKYLDEAVGFRPDLIRLNNQVEYSLFGTLHSWKVVEGKGHYLFMDTYIGSYYGEDYIGYAAILKKMAMLKAISDTLERLGKSLILVHTPAKEYMYPEFFPDNFKKAARPADNLGSYLRIGDSLHLHQIDFNGWFCAMKNTSAEVLYPRQGVHWSVYGSFVAADSLITYIENLRNIKMPHPAWTETEHTTQPRAPDDDIARTLNLIWPITTEVFSYPVVHYTSAPGMVKPRVVYVGDSFAPIWMNDGIPDNTNTGWQVWQWFTLLFSAGSRDGSSNVADSDWVQALNNTDCVVVMYTAFNLPVLGNGFIEKAYEHYFPGGG